MLILFFYIHATYSEHFLILMGTGDGISIFSITLGYIFLNSWAQVHVLASSYRCTSHVLTQLWGKLRCTASFFSPHSWDGEEKAKGDRRDSAKCPVHPHILQYLCSQCDIKYFGEGHRYWISNFIKIHSWLPTTKLKKSKIKNAFLLTVLSKRIRNWKMCREKLFLKLYFSLE